MSLTGRMGVIAGALLLAASLTPPSAAHAGSFLKKFNNSSLSELRSEVRNRFKKSGSKSNSDSDSDSDSDWNLDSVSDTLEGTKVKIDRAGIRRMLDRYLPNN